MTLLQHNGFRSLRSQLVLSSLLVQVVMLAILVWNSVRITDNALHQLFQDHVDSMVTMMAVSLANPLAQRDYATLDERLGRFLQQDSLIYVAVRDELGRVVAQRGEVPKKERLDSSFDLPDKIYGQAFDITVAGRVVGRAHYGLDVSLLKATLSNMRTQGIALALIAILLTFLLLATIVYLVTHRLRALALAAHAIRSGDYSVRVAVVGRDEVAVTAQTFNSMAETLEHDIHQRKQAEAALKESERRFRATLENVQLLVVSMDTAGNITFCNDFMLARTGWSREEVIGRHWFTMFLPESGRAPVWRMFQQAIASGDLPLHYENEIITRSGELRLIHWNNTLLRDPGSKLLGSVSLGEDITEYKQAEEKLKQSEQRLRNIIDGLGPDMFVGLLSTDGVLLEANQQALAAAGLKPEDVLGKPFEETYWFSYSDDIKQQLRQAVTRAAHGEASRYDVQIRAAENQLIPLDFSLQPFRDAAGKVVLLVPSAIVITERVQAEQALRESEAKFRAIIESSPVALAMNDQHGNVTLLNRKFIETFGYTLADIPTLDKWWLLAYPDPAYRQRVVREWQVAVEKVQRDQTELEPLEYKVTCADGSVHDILFSMAPMDGSSLVIFQDFTERKRAEREREQLFASAEAAHAATETLRQAVAEMFNRVSDAFVSLDKDWRYTYVNNQAAALFGRLPGQLLGKQIWTEFPEGLGQPFQLAYEKAMAEQLPVFFEDYYPPYDRWFENRIYPSPDGLTIYFHDITERKRAVEALREGEERLRLALDAAHMGTFDWDIQNDLITWSRWHEDLWGIKPGKSGNTFEIFAQRVHPEDLPGINAEIARCIAARELFVHEWRVVWPDGSAHWISSRGEFTFGTDGQPQHMRGVVVEITQRKQAEILLSGERIVMELIVEGAPLSEILEAITRSVEAMSGDTLCSILLVETEGVHLQHGAAPSLPADYNRAIHGIKIGPQAGSCGTAVYRNQPVIVTDIATDPLWDNYRALALAHGLRACWSTPIRAVDGRVMGSFALYYREPRTPGPADFELIARMTPLAAIAIERRRAEQALRESEAHFHTLFEQAPDGIFLCDAQGKFLDVNVAGCRQLAYSRDELLKLNITDILAVEEVPRLAPERVRLKDGNVAHSEWLFRRSDGSVFPGDLSAKQLPDGRVQAFMHDITERKQAEATMLADSRQLQALSKRVLEVQEAERRHVARELHDELGQILTAIKINLQARNRLNGQSPVEIDSANISMVEDAIGHVRRMALALRPPMIDDLGLLPALHWAVEQSIARAGLAVQWQCDLADQRLAPEIETACFRIAQEAFTNIMRHAQAHNVKIEVRHAGDQLLLIVQDDGCGFDVAAMRARATAGISIGVLGMQERAALAGGQLQIESVPGQGTIIRANFPWRVSVEGRMGREEA